VITQRLGLKIGDALSPEEIHAEQMLPLLLMCTAGNVNTKKTSVTPQHDEEPGP
jgi:hypothetical protein